MLRHSQIWSDAVPAIPILLLSCSLANAACNLSGFDATDPRALKDSVHNTYADFTWASDVDKLGDRFRIWHYILNTSQKGLGVDWDKADIHAALVNPIPPGEASCTRILVDDPPSTDTDAKIVYGISRQHQRAAVYADLKPASNAGKPITGSTVNSSYQDKSGKRVDVDVGISSGVTKEGVYLSVQHTPGLIVGISGLRKLIPASTFDILFSDLKKQSVNPVLANYSEFTKRDTKEAFGEASVNERLTQEFLFLSGSPKWVTQIPAKSYSRKAADVVVLTPALEPILMTRVTLLIPDAR